jgi:hypothetical protein
MNRLRVLWRIFSLILDKKLIHENVMEKNLIRKQQTYFLGASDPLCLSSSSALHFSDYYYLVRDPTYKPG